VKAGDDPIALTKQTLNTTVTKKYLQTPQIDDSLVKITQKLTALAEAVQQGQSIAAVTYYEPMNTAVAEMTPQELQSYRKLIGT
jgi:hypothetical protein